MQFLKDMTYKKWMMIGCVISIYVVLAHIFQCLCFIPSMLSINETKSMNDLFYNFAISYLSGCFVFYLTCILKDKIVRQNNKWAVYDYLMRFQEANVFIESQLGIRASSMSFHDYNNLDEDVKNEFAVQISELLKSARIYESILTNNENKNIAKIRQGYKVFIGSNRNDTKKTKETKFETLKELCECITELNNSACNLVK